MFSLKILSLAEVYLNKKYARASGIVVDMCTVVFILGACISYNIIIGDVLTPFVCYM